MGPLFFLSGLIFFLGYAWLHLLLAWTNGLQPGANRLWPGCILALAILMLAWGPLLLHLFVPNASHSRSSAMMVSSTWMMMILWFGFAMLCCDGVNLCGWLWRHFVSGAPNPPLLVSWRLEALTGALFTLVAATTGYIQAGHPVVRHIQLSSQRIPKAADGYRIMLCSDLHAGAYYRTSVLDAVEEAMRQWQPQLLLHTGDFVDGPSQSDLTPLVERIAGWHLPDGKYACFGNHDGYAGWESSLEWHRQAGLEILGQRSGRIDAFPQPWLHLAGIDDPAVWVPNYRHGRDKEAVEAARLDNEALKAPPESCYNIILRHRPEMRADNFPGWQLMVSGHTHGGQIFPFNLVIPFTCPFSTSRCHTLDTGLGLYVSPGTGSWGPPFRFLVPPEITLIELNSAAEAAKP